MRLFSIVDGRMLAGSDETLQVFADYLTLRHHILTTAVVGTDVVLVEVPMGVIIEAWEGLVHEGAGSPRYRGR